MRFEDFSFGSIRIDGTTYEHDVVIDRGQIRKRNKKPSKKFRDEFGHTPLSIGEEIPWKCRRLIIDAIGFACSGPAVPHRHPGAERARGLVRLAERNSGNSETGSFL